MKQNSGQNNAECLGEVAAEQGEGRVGKNLTAVDVQLTIVLSTRKMYFETVFLSFYR